MKTFQKSLSIMILVAFVFAVFSLNPIKIEAGGKSETIKILTSAVCEMCKERIEKAVYNTKGVKSVVLDEETKIATVKFNPKKVSADVIKTVISNAGYRADDVPANETAFNKLPGCCRTEGACTKNESKSSQ